MTRRRQLCFWLFTVLLGALSWGNPGYGQAYGPALRQPAFMAPAAAAPFAGAADSIAIDDIQSLGGSLPTAAVSGTLAYVGEGAALITLDVSDPASPARLGRLALPDKVTAIAVEGALVGVLLPESAVLIDVSNPREPELLGSIDKEFIAIKMVGSRAYVRQLAGSDGTARLTNDLMIFDISYPLRPNLLGTYTNETLNGGWEDAPGLQDFDVAGDYAYLAYAGGLLVLDVRKPSQPVEVALIGSRMRMVTALGATVYVCSVADDHFGLGVIDVSDPANPAWRDYANPAVYYKLVGAGDRAYGLHYGGAVDIFDTADPQAPVLAGSISATGSWDLDAAGDEIYLERNGSSFEIVDVAQPEAPHVRAAYAPAITAVYDTEVIGAQAYLSTDQGLRVLDISQPLTPTIVAEHSATTRDLLIDGSYAYLVDDAAVRVLDLSAPAGPEMIGSVERIPLEHPWGPAVIPTDYVKVAKYGAALYVSEDERFEIYDLTDPLSPSLRLQRPISDFTENNDFTENIAIVEGNLYRLSAAKMIAFSLSDPFSPTLQSTYALSDTWHAAFEGHLAYLSDEVLDSQGSVFTLKILDLSDPSHASQIGQLALPRELRVAGVAVAEGLVFLNTVVYDDANLSVVERATRIVDARDPAHPVLQNDGGEPARAYSDIRVSKDWVYSGENTAGFQVGAWRTTAPIATTGGVLESGSRRVRVNVPGGAAAEAASLRHTRLRGPIAPLPAGLVAVQSFELAAVDATQATLGDFAQPYEARIAYDRRQLAIPGVSEASLAVLAWDDASGTWQQVDAQVDRARHRITFQSPRLTRFVLAGRPYRVYFALLRR